MFSALQQLSRSLRISMRAAKVSRKLQTIDPAQGAHVALMAALIKTEMLNDPVPGVEATIREIAEGPFNYSKDICYRAFCLLKEKRLLARARVKAYAANNIAPPSDVGEHMKLCDLALSLWMITLAVRCGPSTLERVTNCWRRVASFSASVSDVKALMLRSDYGFCNFSRQQPIATKEWIWLANKMPDFLEIAK
jgi:hypothetical protein